MKKNKKEFLYITSLWTGIREFFFEAREEFSGMPSFYKLFERILNDERTGTLHIILLCPKKADVIIPDKYKNKLKVYPLFGFNKKIKIIVGSVGVIKLGYAIVKRSKIDLIFGHGPMSFVAGILSFLTGVENVRRLYGVSELLPSKSKANWKIFLKHPFLFLSFILPAKALIITNDGSQGDYFNEKIGNRNNKLIFELNGVDFDHSVIVKPQIVLPENFMTYIGRICDFKRQKHFVDSLIQLKNKGIYVQTYIVGQISDEKYNTEIVKLVEDNELNDMVIFTGGLPLGESLYMLKNSMLTFSLYGPSNLGNVFIEAFSLGVPMVSQNVNNSLSYFPKNTYYNCKDDSPLGIASVIEQAINDPEERIEIGNNAREFTKLHVKTWEERYELEMKLLF